MRTPIGIIIAIATMLLLDFYVFMGVKTVSEDASPRNKLIIYSIYWIISLLAVAAFVSFILFGQDMVSRRFKSYFFAILIGLFFAKLITALFLFMDDIRRLLQWGSAKLLFSNTEAAQMSDATISRSVFLTWFGMAAGSTLFGSLLYGFSNKYNYKTKHVKIPFENLPEAFNGFKVLHFSDVHSGSFNNKKAVIRGVEKIMAEKADLVIFSGDLVNDRTSEMEEYMDVFNKVKAPFGVYSTLGNHDYGDYARWPFNGITKEQNLENLKKVHADLGWKLMMNEHVPIEKDGAQFALLGIENWGAKARFPKYGDLSKAYKGTEK
ncbi:MAG: metallophosphoesterase, partial [Ginsengibacter sp.]